MRVPRTIRARLTLLFLLIVAAAIGGLYLYVVPHAAAAPDAGQARALRQATARYGPSVSRAVNSSRPAFAVAAEVRGAASATASRVALLRVGRAGGEPRTELVTDSSGPRPADDLRYGIGLDAVRSGRTVTGTESASTGQWAQAAGPFARTGGSPSVVVISPAAGRRAAQRQRRAPPDPRRRRPRARLRRARRLRSWPARSRGASAASSTRPRRSPPATSRARSRSTPTTSSAT